MGVADLPRGSLWLGKEARWVEPWCLGGWSPSGWVGGVLVAGWVEPWCLGGWSPSGWVGGALVSGWVES